MALPAAFMPEVECAIHDFRSLRMKPEHAQKPFWVLPDSRIILESSSPVYKEAEALLIAIANPVSRTRFLQEYELKPDSLYAGASMGLTTADILNAMERFSKNELPPQVRELIHTETSRYGKVKVVTRSHQLFIECRNQPEVLEELLRDPTLADYRPVLQLPRCQLRVNGKSKKTLDGSFRFLPKELVARFEAYRRLELKYAQITAMRAVRREAGGVLVAGNARFELRFRLNFKKVRNEEAAEAVREAENLVLAAERVAPAKREQAVKDAKKKKEDAAKKVKEAEKEAEQDLKRFHTALALTATTQLFDPTNPTYDPRNSEHELCLGFANEADRRRFGRLVLQHMRAAAGPSASHETGTLDEWAAEPAEPADEQRAGGVEPAQGGGGSAAQRGAPLGDEEDERLRSAEDGDDDDEGGGAGAHIEELEVEPTKIKEVKARCRALKWPLLEEYDFRNDTSAPALPIELKHNEKSSIREYQTQALSRVFGNHRARSGIIVLPCGSGKTLVGVTAACTMKRSTLVLCNSSVSVEQWYQQFRMWAQIAPDRISRFTSNMKEPLHKEACVLVSTYGMIGHTGNRAADTRELMEQVSDREWGLIILDEVHVAPADTFLTCMTTRTRSRCKLGLTATLVREDDGIALLEQQIGPKLYEANWLDLQEKGYIANVSCAEVWCKMTPEFYREYIRAEHAANIQRLLYAMNPTKFRACEYLMRYHEARGDKVIIFSDNVFALKEYATRLNRPAIDGSVSQTQRMCILGDFKGGAGFNTVLISKVGDTSIDLPEANVIIQVASHFGARRQEAQRLGRILRPKARSGNAFNAFFYTLVSQDTKEMFYSGKRQQFLVDQGYSFRVLTELPGMDDDLSGLYEPDVEPKQRKPLKFGSQKEQLDLLCALLANDETKVMGAEEADDLEMARADGAEGDDAGAGAGVKRKASSMSALSGAGPSKYIEKPRGSEKLLKDFRGR